MLIRIEAPHFVAGIDLWPIRKAAPIIKYMETWEKDKIINYCKKKGWKWEIIKK